MEAIEKIDFEKVGKRMKKLIKRDGNKQEGQDTRTQEQRGYSGDP